MHFVANEVLRLFCKQSVPYFLPLVKPFFEKNHRLFFFFLFLKKVLTFPLEYAILFLLFSRKTRSFGGAFLFVGYNEIPAYMAKPFRVVRTN
jgi:hypothetical protein